MGFLSSKDTKTETLRHSGKRIRLNWSQSLLNLRGRLSNDAGSVALECSGRGAERKVRVRLHYRGSQRESREGVRGDVQQRPGMHICIAHGHG